MDMHTVAKYCTFMLKQFDIEHRRYKCAGENSTGVQIFVCAFFFLDSPSRGVRTPSSNNTRRSVTFLPGCCVPDQSANSTFEPYKLCDGPMCKYGTSPSGLPCRITAIKYFHWQSGINLLVYLSYWLNKNTFNFVIKLRVFRQFITAFILLVIL